MFCLKNLGMIKIRQYATAQNTNAHRADMLKALVSALSPKLSSIEPTQYLNGWPFRKNVLHKQSVTKRAKLSKSS